jgi:hypothetical protein
MPRLERASVSCHPLSALLLGAAVVCLSASRPALADDPQPPRITKETRIELIRLFETDLVYIRTLFPMGTKGLTLKDGKLSPDGVDLQQMIAMWGPAVKPGDQARISDIEFKGNMIHFEINGGPIRKQKWYQHISVSGAAGETPVAPTDGSANPRGSYVNLVFDQYIPEMDAKHLKELLRPVFDFNAKSPEEAYLDTVAPKVKQAILDHHVLVGMNREMVIYAKGRPPKKVREKDGDTEYEDWIYGEPPEDVDFVRVVNDEVVRVETMTVQGARTIRTAKEVDITRPAEEKAAVEHPAAAPTLRRPGETLPTGKDSGGAQLPSPLPAQVPPSNNARAENPNALAS